MLEWQANCPVTEVSFDLNQQLFIVKGESSREILLTDIADGSVNLVEELIITEDTMPLSAVRTGFASNSMRPTGTRFLQNLLAGNKETLNRALSGAEQAIAVECEVLTGIPVRDPDMSLKTQYGVSVHLDKYGNPLLHTVGNCAQAFVDIEGHIFDPDNDDGITEWNLHNTDADWQIASLWAGLGYLSLQARN